MTECWTIQEGTEIGIILSELKRALSDRASLRITLCEASADLWHGVDRISRFDFWDIPNPLPACLALTLFGK
jgi:hypothetical protein